MKPIHMFLPGVNLLFNITLNEPDWFIPRDEWRMSV
jgi:hypothetical protein